MISVLAVVCAASIFVVYLVDEYGIPEYPGSVDYKSGVIV